MSEYRPIADFDGYIINAQAVVWSVGRTVKTKARRHPNDRREAAQARREGEEPLL